MKTTDQVIAPPGKDGGEVPEPPRYRKPELVPYGQLRPNLQVGSPPPPPP